MAGVDTDWSRIINSSKQDNRDSNAENFTDSLISGEEDTWELDFLS